MPGSRFHSFPLPGASCPVIAHMLRRLPKAGRREKRLAVSWQVRAIRPLLERFGEDA
jgi:hypothetical protein